ncbi:MAG: DUF4384 domain-containing protein, partial [Candidatus Rokuibacteriota bacterium]
MQVHHDLEGAVQALLVSLKQGVLRYDPALGAARATVANFTEEGKPWNSPLGALLQDQVARAVGSGSVFAPAAPPTRGITVKEVASVGNPNDPRALTALHGSDLAILGKYQSRDDAVLLRLSAVDRTGRELAQAASGISRRAIPGAWSANPANVADTGQLLNTLGQLGPRAQGTARVDVATNRPGAGANFRLGEEIRYFVTSTLPGFLYLFHIDADRNMLRIFPNQFQRDPRIRGGEALEIPAHGAPFKFEASPPFGLETTFAIVTTVPLDERDFQTVDGGFARPTQAVAGLRTTRGIRVADAGTSAA